MSLFFKGLYWIINKFKTKTKPASTQKHQSFVKDPCIIKGIIEISFEFLLMLT